MKRFLERHQIDPLSQTQRLFERVERLSSLDTSRQSHWGLLRQTFGSTRNKNSTFLSGIHGDTHVKTPVESARRSIVDHTFMSQQQQHFLPNSPTNQSYLDKSKDIIDNLNESAQSVSVLRKTYGRKIMALNYFAQLQKKGGKVL